jgi:hypothetical protein
MTKKPTLADINKRNKEVWDVRKKRSDELLAHLPTAKMAFAVYQAQVKQTSFADQKPYDFSIDAAATLIAEHSEALRSAVNSVNGSEKRPGRKSKHKEVVVAAMRQARLNDQELDAFLAGAAIKSWEDLAIKKVTAKGVVARYDIECAGLKKIRRDHKTLQGWWAEANPELAG